MNRTLLGRAALFAGVVASAPGASAQDRAPTRNGPGLDTHLFRPAVDSKGFFTVNGSDTFGQNGISFGLIGDYGHDIMHLQEGHGGNALVEHAFQGTFFFNYGVTNWLELGLQAPVDLSTGNSLTAIGPAGAPYDSDPLNAQYLPYVALHAKVRITRPQQALGLAIVAQAGLPTTSGAARDLTADAKFWYWPEVVIDKHFGRENEAGLVRVGLNAGYRGTSADGTTTYDQLEGGHFESRKGLFTGGLAASVRVFPPLDLVAETYGTKQADGSSASKVSTSAEVVGGVKIFVERNSYLMLGGGVRYTEGYEAASQRGFLGFVYEPSIDDRDGDGIADDEDACPDVPGVRSADPRKNGCPPDRDGDGIPDSEDACPDVPGVRSDDPRKNGCPPDRDRDGIPDNEDACPDVPGPRSDDPHQNGCPPANDRDHDGIPDSEDACPDVYGVPDPDPKKNGCPPKDKKVIVEGNNVVIFEKILFERGSAKILPASDSLLDEVGATLKEHSELGLIEVQGHADERGSEQLNLRLTGARAASVVAALEKRGVPASHLRPMGYGKYCPLDPSHNEAAWEKNRRVEFKIVVSNGSPTGAVLGCDEAKQHGVESKSP